MSVEVFTGPEILGVIPHRPPYVLVDTVTVEKDNEGVVLGAEGTWQSYHLHQDAANGTFWGDVHASPTPFIQEKYQGGKNPNWPNMLVDPKWSAFPGHFYVVPGVEIIRQMAIDAAAEGTDLGLTYL